MDLRSTIRHRSELATITDVRCRAHAGGCGAEEHAGGDAIVLPRAGLFVRHVRGAEVVAQPGRALFFARGEDYRVSHPIAGGDDCTVLEFAPTMLAEAFRDGPRPFGVASCATPPHVTLLQQGIRRLLHPEPAASDDTLAIDELALRLLDDVAQAAMRPISRPPPRRRRADTRRAHRDLANDARRLLAAGFRDRLSLAELARRLHTSPFHLARVFRAATGEPLHRHRLRLRLHEALERLADGDRDLTRLALSLGFSSHAHLTDSFRRTFGVAPARFRDRLTAARLREMSKKLEAAAFPAA